MEICGGQSVTVTGFFRVLQFFRVNITPSLLHIQSYIIWWMEKLRVTGPVSHHCNDKK
jgi:hypothetical protein